MGKLRDALTEALSGLTLGGTAKGSGVETIFSSIISKVVGIFGGSRTIDLGGGSTARPGGTGTTRDRTVTTRDITSQTRELNQATGQQTNTLSNTIQLTGQQIIQGLRPAQQSFFSGLIQAAITGAVSGLTSGAFGGGGSSGGGSTSVGVFEGADPEATRPRTVGRGFARGGYLQPGEWGIAGENGPEQIYGGRTGMSVMPNQSAQPIVNNYYTINVPVKQAGSYASPRSRREVAEQISMTLQGALT